MVFDREQAQDWSLRLALGTTGMVLLLSWFNQVSLTLILWRSVVAFGVVYGLTLGSLFLFEKSSADSGKKSGQEIARESLRFSVGSMVDQTVGAEDREELNELFAAGQINDALTDPKVDMEQRAEILRKMGWTAEERTENPE